MNQPQPTSKSGDATDAPDLALLRSLDAVRERTLDALAALPERVGRYAVRGELGHGGMGIVYDGYDPVLERPVAVKVIHHERLRGAEDPASLGERFQREMRATSGFFHPNVVAILDAGFDDEAAGLRAYYVMERIAGDSLEQRLQRCGALPRHSAFRIAAEIARGLAAVHSHGLVHRDLKPANVLLPEAGPAKVADFGLCCLRAQLGELGDRGPVLGSAHFVAPEQVRAEPVDASADLFALGGILLRMLTGRSPFGAPDMASHLERIVRDEPDGLDELDPEARSLVERLLAKRAAERPPSAAAVAEELEALRASTASGREASSHEARGALPPPSGPGLRWAIAGLAFVALLVAGALLARNHVIALDAGAELQWEQVRNEVTRQSELLPELAELTERYASHERDVIERVIAARSPWAGAVAGDSSREPENAARVARALSDVVVIAERYPELAADRHYRDLRHEIAGSANRVAVERMRYNAAAGALNERLRQLPWRLFAGDLEERPFFTATGGFEAIP